jgi:hypothetical protein
MRKRYARVSAQDDDNRVQFAHLERYSWTNCTCDANQTVFQQPLSDGRPNRHERASLPDGLP